MDKFVTPENLSELWQNTKDSMPRAMTAEEIQEIIGDDSPISGGGAALNTLKH